MTYKKVFRQIGTKPWPCISTSKGSAVSLLAASSMKEVPSIRTRSVAVQLDQMATFSFDVDYNKSNPRQSNLS